MSQLPLLGPTYRTNDTCSVAKLRQNLLWFIPHINMAIPTLQPGCLGAPRILNWRSELEASLDLHVQHLQCEFDSIQEILEELYDV